MVVPREKWWLYWSRRRSSRGSSYSVIRASHHHTWVITFNARRGELFAVFRVFWSSRAQAASACLSRIRRTFRENTGNNSETAIELCRLFWGTFLLYDSTMTFQEIMYREVNGWKHGWRNYAQCGNEVKLYGSALINILGDGGSGGLFSCNMYPGKASVYLLPIFPPSTDLSFSINLSACLAQHGWHISISIGTW